MKAGNDKPVPGSRWPLPVAFLRINSGNTTLHFRWGRYPALHLVHLGREGRRRPVTRPGLRWALTASPPSSPDMRKMGAEFRVLTTMATHATVNYIEVTPV